MNMSLERMQEYLGINECPEDLDAYWDEGIREMEALGTDCVLEEVMSLPNALCYDLWFTGVGGAKVHAIFVRPREITAPVPAVLKFHGYASNCGPFYDLLAWTSAGMCAAAMDCRGQYGKSEDVSTNCGTTWMGHIVRGAESDDPRRLYFRNVFLDTAQLARIIMAMDFVDEKRVGAFGRSQGGALTLACAALTPTLNRIVSEEPFLSDFRRVWQMHKESISYTELYDHFRWFDPQHKHEKEFFTKLGYIDVHNLAHRIRAKVLMCTGLQDPICLPSTQFAIYNNLRTEKDMHIYPDFKHETLPHRPDDMIRFLMAME